MGRSTRRSLFLPWTRLGPCYQTVWGFGVLGFKHEGPPLALVPSEGALEVVGLGVWGSNGLRAQGIYDLGCIGVKGSVSMTSSKFGV